MDEKRDKMTNDRAGGTSQRCGNPPAVKFFITDKFTPKTTPPKPMTPSQLRKVLPDYGFPDGDTNQAEHILDRIGYQHLLSYFSLLQCAPEDYRTFKTLHQIALFDRRLQTVLMEGIGVFELQFRAQYSYALSEKNGAFAHRDSGNFKRQDYYQKFLESYEREVTRQIKQRNTMALEAIETYGDLPLWQAVEIMSFGTLSMLYRNTRSRSVKKQVADSFGVNFDTFISWMRAISAVRNQCAHFGSICPYSLTSKPKRIPGLSFTDNGHFFYIVLVIEYLLSRDPVFEDDLSLKYSLTFAKSVTVLFKEFNHYLPIVGIPENWAELLFSEQITGTEWEHTGDDAGVVDDISVVISNEDGTMKRIHL